MKIRKKREGKGLRRFFTRTEEKYRDANLQDANIVKRLFFIVSSNIKNILVFVCILAALWTLISYVGSFGKRTVTLSLNYEEASKGQNPNLTRYNVYELKSEEMMEKVIEYGGLQDEIEPLELADCIEIDEANMGKAIDPLDESTYYISTSYTITYKHPSQIKSVSVDDMTELICKAYNDTFHEEYVGTRSVLQYDLGDIEGMEYIEIAKQFTKKSDQMLQYIQQRIKENATYRSDVTGQSFQTINKMIQNVQAYSIRKYYSFVLESGLSRNREHYLRTLNYKNDMFDIKYRKHMIDYNVRKQGVQNYDSAMIGTVMVPSVNERREYYMSRTNIGTDYLTRDADYSLSQGNEVQRDVIENNDIISKVSSSTASQADYEKAEELIKSVDAELKNVAAIADTTDKEYIKHTTKDYLTFKATNDNSGITFFLSTVIGSAVVFFVLLSIIYYVVDGYIRRREDGLSE